MAAAKKKAAAKLTPMQTVKEKFGGKAALARELAAGLLRKDGETEDELAKRLTAQSNTKLLHLYAVEQQVKALGGREALIQKVMKQQGHATKGSDADFERKLSGYSPARLIDLLNAKSKKVKNA